MADKPKKVTRTWDSYVKEAAQPPFVIVVDDETSITVNAPTGDQIIEGEAMFRADASASDALKVVCGDAADAVLELCRPAPAGAMNQLLTDIMEHFNFGASMSGETPSRT
jgi:hypothetical protein